MNIFLQSVKCLWLISVTRIFDGTPQIIVQRCQIAAPRRPNDISTAADNAIFKTRAQNIDCSFVYVSRSAVLLPISPSSIFMNKNFCVPKCDNFDCLPTRRDQNELDLKRWFFFLLKSASSVSLLQAHLAKRKPIGWSIGFNSWTNWTLYGVICKMMFPKCSIVANDGELMLMAFHAHIRVYAMFLAFHIMVYHRHPVSFTFFTR